MTKMITFSCKNISEKELIRCSFNLNKTDYDLLIFMLKRDGAQTVLEVASTMGLERTTVQKAMKHLVDKGLVKRDQTNLSGGGYVFSYSPNNKEDIKNRMKDITRKWYDSVEEAIDKL